MPYFQPKLFTFLRDLEKNNNRDWFKANKARYEDCLKGPALEFISDFGPHLAKISPHFVADPRPVGGSLFRIHRDTRFAKDKTPYKTSVGIHFRHEVAKDAHAPGLYLHLAQDECFFGLGLWQPESSLVLRIRTAIVEDSAAWKRAAHGKKFTSEFSLGGESLKRPPRGFDKEHPWVEDLKRKSFMATTPLTRKQATGERLGQDLVALSRAGAPFVKFLCSAVDVPY